MCHTTNTTNALESDTHRSMVLSLITLNSHLNSDVFFLHLVYNIVENIVIHLLWLFVELLNYFIKSNLSIKTLNN